VLVGPDGHPCFFAQIPYAEFPKFILLCSDYAKLCPIMLSDLPKTSSIFANYAQSNAGIFRTALSAGTSRRTRGGGGGGGGEGRGGGGGGFDEDEGGRDFSALPAVLVRRKLELDGSPVPYQAGAATRQLWRLLLRLYNTFVPQFVPT
jgi:hypothetical protein